MFIKKIMTWLVICDWNRTDEVRAFPEWELLILWTDSLTSGLGRVLFSGLDDVIAELTF